MLRDQPTKLREIGPFLLLLTIPTLIAADRYRSRKSESMSIAQRPIRSLLCPDGRCIERSHNRVFEYRVEIPSRDSQWVEVPVQAEVGPTSNPPVEVDMEAPDLPESSPDPELFNPPCCCDCENCTGSPDCPCNCDTCTCRSQNARSNKVPENRYMGQSAGNYSTYRYGSGSDGDYGTYRYRVRSRSPIAYYSPSHSTRRVVRRYRSTRQGNEYGGSGDYGYKVYYSSPPTQERGETGRYIYKSRESHISSSNHQYPLIRSSANLVRGTVRGAIWGTEAVARSTAKISRSIVAVPIRAVQAGIDRVAWRQSNRQSRREFRSSMKIRGCR